MNYCNQCKYFEYGCLGVHGETPVFEGQWEPGMDCIYPKGKCPGFSPIPKSKGWRISTYIGGEYDITETLVISMTGFQLVVNSLVDTREYKLSIKEGMKTLLYIVLRKLTGNNP